MGTGKALLIMHLLNSHGSNLFPSQQEKVRQRTKFILPINCWEDLEIIMALRGNTHCGVVEYINHYSIFISKVSELGFSLFSIKYWICKGEKH